VSVVVGPPFLVSQDDQLIRPDFPQGQPHVRPEIDIEQDEIVTSTPDLIDSVFRFNSASLVEEHQGRGRGRRRKATS
jgi:hypothetical protein